jgi:hypothetical protein
MLKGEGDTRTRVEKRVRHECAHCGEPATYCVTFLLENARSNPASAGYGKDNISWCSDSESWACDNCQRTVERDPPTGMEWCASFPGEKFPHMVLHWKPVREELVPSSETAEED